MRGKLLAATALVASTLLASCGGGGGGSLSTSSGSVTLTGTVEASKVAGVKVCVEGTDNCALTDEKGTFSLQVAALPVTVSLMAGDAPIGSFNATSPVVEVNPLTLVDGNVTLAAALGAVIHALAGDTTGNQTTINLSNVAVKVDKPLVELLKEAVSSNQTVTITTDDGKEIEVACSNGTLEVLVDGQEVNYDSCLYADYWKLKAAIAELDGKEVLFSDGTVCKLKASVTDDGTLSFSLNDCSDSKRNGTYEVVLEDQFVEFINDSGATCPANLREDGQICSFCNSTEVCFVGYDGKHDLEDFTTIYSFKSVTFYPSNGNKFSCVLVRDPINPKQFMFTMCSDSENNDSYFKRIVKEEDGKYWVTDADNATILVYNVNLADGTFEFKFEDEEQEVTGRLEVDKTSEPLSDDSRRLFFSSIQFIHTFSGVMVSGDESKVCGLIPDKNFDNAFYLVNCSDSGMNGHFYINFNSEGRVIGVDSEDGNIVYIDSVDLTLGTMSFHYYKNGEAVYGEWMGLGSNI
jgi:hypothetical protein